MKKSHLLGAVSAWPFLVMISGVNADLIAGDYSSVTWTGQPHDQAFSVSPLSTSNAALTSAVPGEFYRTQPGENFNHFLDGALPASPDSNSQITPQTNSHMDLWLLLIVAAVVGTLSEVFHRKYFNSQGTPD